MLNSQLSGYTCGIFRERSYLSQALVDETASDAVMFRPGARS
jgi:hypothetical protein